MEWPFNAKLKRKFSQTTSSWIHPQLGANIMEFNVRFLNEMHHGSRRSPTLLLPLGLLWPGGRHLSQWFPAPTASHGRAPPWRAPEAPRHSSPPGPPRCCGTARSYICNESIKCDFFLSLPQLHSSVLQLNGFLPPFDKSTQIKNVMNKNCKKWSGKINCSTKTHTHTQTHKLTSLHSPVPPFHAPASSPLQPAVCVRGVYLDPPSAAPSASPPLPEKGRWTASGTC